MRNLREEAELPDTRHGLRPVGDVQFAVDAGGVGFDRADGDDLLVGDLLIRLARGDELKHFYFALAQWLGQIARCRSFSFGCWKRDIKPPPSVANAASIRPSLMGIPDAGIPIKELSGLVCRHPRPKDSLFSSRTQTVRMGL